jgi:suppressor of ftsI
MSFKPRSSIHIQDFIFSISIPMFVLLLIVAFQSIHYGDYSVLAKNQSSPLAGMNFSKSQDVYSKDGVLKTTLVADYKIGKVDNHTMVLSWGQLCMSILGIGLNLIW